MLIKHLSKDNIEKAIHLLHSIFTEDVSVGEPPSDALRASLEPQKYQTFLKKWGIKTIEYFIVLDKYKSVVGTTGLYTLNQDAQNTVWLGWYCIAPAKRGKGFGSMLLQWTIDEARSRGFEIMKLYTSDSPMETDSSAARIRKVWIQNYRSRETQFDTQIYNYLQETRHIKKWFWAYHFCRYFSTT